MLSPSSRPDFHRNIMTSSAKSLMGSSAQTHKQGPPKHPRYFQEGVSGQHSRKPSDYTAERKARQQLILLDT